MTTNASASRSSPAETIVQRRGLDDVWLGAAFGKGFPLRVIQADHEVFNGTRVLLANTGNALSVLEQPHGQRAVPADVEDVSGPGWNTRTIWQARCNR